ncbi:MAG: EFR1 family ferrodoxin [Treponemataceae bacterium]|nr:EFR1 family ferrodoxin [Treponemataceae bacterium]
MKAILYYYSGTGNTELVAKLYQKYFKDYQVEIYKIHQLEEGESFPNPNDYDLVGMGFPIYGFNSPEPAYNFAKLLPAVDGPEKKKAFVFRTSGEGLGVNNFAGQKIMKCMSKKGYEFMTDWHIVMPYNMVFRHSPEMVKSEYIYADAIVRLNVKFIQGNVHEKVMRCPIPYFFVPIVRIVWPYAKIQGKLIMHARKKDCIGCGLCEKICPMHNVKLVNGLPKFGGNCCLCVGCVFNCPKKAISIGLLNGMVQHGSYRIEKTAKDPGIAFPAFGEDLKGLKRWAYYRYYRQWDKKLAANGINLDIPSSDN